MKIKLFLVGLLTVAHFTNFNAQTVVSSAIPLSPTNPNNCIPFGTTSYGPFSGFIYKNIPAFAVSVGDTIAFDLGGVINVSIKRDIFLAHATNASSPLSIPAGFSQIVSSSQTPLNSFGNTIIGDYELKFVVETAYTFPGGTLIIALGGGSADSNCAGSTVGTNSSDISNQFLGRFFSIASLGTSLTIPDYGYIGGYKIIDGICRKAKTDNVTACVSYLWRDGNTYTSSNTTATHTVVDAFATDCDSVYTLNLTINALDDAAFAYGSSSYCMNASNPAPTITGITGGSFGSTTGLSINASTGIIDVSSSTAGTYVVTYTTAGNCPNSSNFSITINAMDDASFTYAATSYCQNTTNLPAPTITGLTGGVFSSTSGLTINAASGQINTNSSTSGPYTISYTTAGTCPEIGTTNVTILTTDDASFSYSANAYCSNAPDALPSITGLSGGSFQAGTGLQIDASTGLIDVSASTPGNYTVVYTTSGSCPNTATFTVTINSTETSSINVTECTTYTWSANNTTYTASGTYTANFSNIFGCDSIATLNLLIEDITAPATPLLSNLNGSCDLVVTSPTTIDNCAGTITGTTNDAITFNIPGVYAINWIFNDGNGNATSAMQQVTIIDTIAPIPTLTSLTDVTSQCEVLIAPTAPTADDNCAGTITGTTTTIFPITVQGTTIITWTFADGNGNTTMQTQNLVINDTTSPTPSNATLMTVHAGCELASLPTPTANDNCNGIINATTTQIFPITAMDTTVVMWTFADASGNTTTQTQLVVISSPDVQIALNGSTLTATPASGMYKWINCADNSIIAGATANTFTPANGGSYKAVRSIAALCSDTSDCIQVNYAGLEKNSVEKIVLYPNPSTNGKFTVKYTGSIKDIYAIDMLGRKIKLHFDRTTNEVDGSDLSPAKYMVAIETEQGVLLEQIIIIK